MEEYKRLIKEADEVIERLDSMFKEMKDKGLKICSKCQFTIYPDKEHNCSVR